MVHGTGKVIHPGLSKSEPGEAWPQGACRALETQHGVRQLKKRRVQRPESEAPGLQFLTLDLK